MDDRQQQIQVGAGLQESRLNTDLIAFLEKWGTWILTIVLVLVAGYVGLAKYKEYNATKHDEAFEQYAAARGTMGTDGVLQGSPDNLLKIAAEHGSRGSIAHLARLDAAEIKLGSVRRGLRVGTDLAAIKPEDALAPEEAAALTKEAGELFAQVKSSTTSDKSLAVFNLRAQWGLAAVAVNSGDLDTARKVLSEIESAATTSGFTEQADQAKKRAVGLDALASPPVLLSDKDLPAIVTATPVPNPGVPGAGSPIIATTPDGTTVPVTQMPPDFDPTIVPTTPARTAEDIKPAEPAKPGEPFVIPPQQGQPGQPAPTTPPTEQPKPEAPKP